MIDTASSLQLDTVLDRIGNTPLLEIPMAGRGSVRVAAKAEFLNPGGSVKDRPAMNIIREGEKSGKLTRDKVLLDSTSGNTGIAYAMICAAKGYRVKLCLPANASAERKRILMAYGAELVLTDAAAGSDGSLLVCQKIYADDPNRYFYADQYGNPANWHAHTMTTGPEIIRQTEGRLTHFVAAIGTSGTFMGTTRALRERLPHVRCITVQPSTPLHGLEGTKHMPSAIQPAIYDASLADDNIWIDTEDAYDMARRLARQSGLLLGVSAAANLLAASRVAQQVADKGESGLVVTILCDGGIKYLSDPFWTE